MGIKLIILVSLVLISLGMGGASAKSPKVGDHIQVIVGSGMVNMVYNGYIEDFPDGLICLNCTQAEISGSKAIINSPEDICIGIGQICLIQWLDRHDMPIMAS